MVNKLKVACLQVSAREYEDRYENKENILRIIDRAAESHPQLMVLPECVYPAYYISPLIVKNSLEFQQSTLELIAEVKQRAKLYKCYIALGIVETDLIENIFYNSALLINPEGQEISCFRKSYLWHFDSRWFCAGEQYPIVETEFGKVGMFICADGRLPEIVRCLSLQGADILLDLTNWVTSGFEKETLTNPQVEYMIPTRALENRIWIIAANKVGMEAKSILYCGKSAVFTPDGKVAKIASSCREEILFYEISLEKAKNKIIDNQIDTIDDRKPELYSELAQPTDTLPIYSIMKKKTNPKNPNPLTAVVQIEFEDNFKKYLQKIEFFINNLGEQETDIIIFPECNFIFPENGEEIIRKVKQITKDSKIIGLDINKLKEDLLLNEEEIMMLVNLFINKMTKTIPELENAVDSMDYKKIQILAHGIKGSSANFRMENLQNLAGKLESMAKNNDSHFNYQENFELIKSILEDVKIV